ncbi:MAG: Clp1/GlmU family protein [Candidatus Bathyarchaeota archaeon]|nr:Clp1/GlmU family protein [Candidatus Bathyarchaeota archaeon]
MQQTIKPDRTLIVDGPAAVQLVSGNAEVFGYPIKQAKILVRVGKRLPFFVLEEALFDISLGAGASIQEVEGNTIPSSWNKPVEAVLALEKRPAVVLVVGQADSGKSSFCTYMVNKLVEANCKVAVLDGDLGQSDIGPSATVGYAVTSKQVTELYNLRLANAFFAGVTSPVMAVAKALGGYNGMLNEIMQRQVDFVVVNTDGWVSGDDAVRYKASLVKELKPDVLVGVQVAEELAPLVPNLESNLIVVESSSALSPRSPEKRKSLREMSYARYLQGSKVQCYPMSQLTVEPRNAVPKDLEPQKSILVGLYGSENKFLGIGVLRELNPERKVLKVQTAVSAKPKRLVIGKVRLNEKLQEVED